VSSQSAPEDTTQSLSYNTDTASSILLTLECSDNICGCHLLHSLATTPSTNLSIPLAFGLPPSSPSSGEGRGTNQTIYTWFQNPLSLSERSPRSPCMTCALLRSTRGAMQRGNRTPSASLAVGNSPCTTSSARGAMHIKRYIAIQTNIPCISVNWSLLSKGLRGGKEQSDRVVSLLRRMIASEDAKNPLKARKQKGIQGYGLLYPPERRG